MTEHRTKLKTLLRELFQFDAADLDFGIYRIMNQRRAEIDDFVEKGLLDAVAQEFALLQEGVVEEKREELDRVARRIREAYHPGVIDEQGNLTLPEQFMQAELPVTYVRLQTEVKRATVSAEAEAEIFNALYTFFSRYYDQGDFVTKRRYSRTHKYAIPYNGEEVLLHWANRDQYYVKTADVLTDYAFRVDSHGGYRVRFKLAVADTEQGNVKGDKRYFFPTAEGVPSEYDEDGHELTLFFEYRPLNDAEETTYGRARIQEKIIEATRVRTRTISAAPSRAGPRPIGALGIDFIHKDLQGFLERELDFYLKNEVMRLDDLDTENAARAEQYLTKLVVIKRLARKIIAFLAQIEDFEKALFEKPKFVLSSEWCVTLDRAPEGLSPQVAANDAQWAEWERLFGVRKPVGQDGILSYLAEHPTLTVDTALYDVAFKDTLLAALSERDGGLEAQRDGLLVHSENFQALNLLLPRYREQVRCVHIDPPYNTQTSGFLYKNSYQHSSWLAMMENRIKAGIDMMSPDGSYLCHIDENEYEHLQLLFERFSVPNAGTIVWDKRNPMNAGRGIATQHEYVIWRSRQQTPIYLRNENILSILRAAAAIVEKYGCVSKEAQREYVDWINGNSKLSGGEKAYRFLDEQGRVYQSVSLRAPEPRTDPKFHKPLIHPVTRKSCPVPPNGFSRTPETLQNMVDRGEIIFGQDESTQPRQKRLLTEKSRRQIPSLLQDGRKGKADVSRLGLDFPYCHPVSLYEELVGAAAQSPSDIVLDFFAGSGTTAHAVINLNREDGGERKYILVEIGGYFDTVLKPRIQKVIYVADWKNGQPVEGSAGSSHAFQYIRLESYEDTLDNLDLDTEAAPAGLFPPERDDYLLRYFLDHETRRSRLNVESFATPFDYQLRVRRDGVETRVGVDLVETANFLLGLTVQARRAYEHQGRTYRAVFGTTGDQSVVVIWRDTAGLDLEAEAAFIQKEILTQTSPLLAVNGDSHVPNAQPIEAVFMNAMRGAATVRRGGN